MLRRGPGSNQHRDRPPNLRVVHLPDAGQEAMERSARAATADPQLDCFIDGEHLVTGQPWGVDGYEPDGFRPDGFDRDGVHRDTGDIYSPDGVTVDGWRRDGTHAHTGTDRCPDGFDRAGYDRSGRHIDDRI